MLDLVEVAFKNHKEAYVKNAVEGHYRDTAAAAAAAAVAETGTGTGTEEENMTHGDKDGHIKDNDQEKDNEDEEAEKEGEVEEVGEKRKYRDRGGVKDTVTVDAMRSTRLTSRSHTAASSSSSLVNIRALYFIFFANAIKSFAEELFSTFITTVFIINNIALQK